MEKIIFILGRQPALSIAEILAVWPQLKILKQTSQFLMVAGLTLPAESALARLGGTIKIGRVIEESFSLASVAKRIVKQPTTGKVKFGFSYYEGRPDLAFGLKVKKSLQEQGINSRLVSSKEKILSSVIVKKNKCLEFLVFKDFWGMTLAVQDFAEYGRRDFGRPAFDPRSGMLPPKLAKMMLNLSQAKANDLILDSFCGSGTILTEALTLGFKNLIGSDISAKAISDSQKNIAWLQSRDSALALTKVELIKLDVGQLVGRVKNIDAIVTEPYLGQPLTGREDLEAIKKNIQAVAAVYLAAFGQFKKILKKSGRIVMVFPEWHLSQGVFDLSLAKTIPDLGFKVLDQDNLVYFREDQRVWRKIKVFGLGL